MTPHIPSGSAFVSLEIVADFDSEPMFNTWGLNVSGGGISESIANNILTVMTGSLDKFLTTAYSWTRVRLETATTFVDSTGPAIPGINAQNALTQNTATLISKNTGLKGRENKGRVFVPGLEEDAADDGGVLLPATQTVLQTAIETWSASVLAIMDVDAFVILHAGVSPIPTPISSVKVESKVATQRRRLRPG